MIDSLDSYREKNYLDKDKVFKIAGLSVAIGALFLLSLMLFGVI